MYNVLVVDDEKTIRKGLIGFINWSYLDCSIIADVENGIEAKEIIQNNHIDIIISDIKMPGIDGIELAKYIYEMQLDIKIIFYTGYSDFEYAKLAIKYDVEDFILKPSSTDQITTTIKDVIAKIDEERTKDDHLKTLEYRLKDIVDKEKFEFIRDLVNGYIFDLDDINKNLEKHNINLDSYCILLYKLDDESPNDNIRKIMTFISLSLNDMKQFTFIYNQSTICSFIILDDKTKSNAKEILIKKCEKLVDFVNGFIKSDIAIGVSDIFDEASKIRECAMQSEKCLERTFFDFKHITIYSDISTLNNTPIASLDMQNIFDFIKLKKAANATNAINIMFRNLEENQEPIDYIRSTGISIYSKCLNVLISNNLSLTDVFDDKDVYTNLLKSKSIVELKQLIIAMVSGVINCTLEDNSNYIIKKTLSFIDEHYEKPIKLNDIANEIHINSSYLSRIFKQKTGETITQTLRDKRIERAKSLLESSDIKTYEVASMIGFDDPSYFSFVFKQATGLTPCQYKKFQTKN